MPRTCSECSFDLKNIDPHTTCVQHSPCLNPPYFDPRQCEHCITLFGLAKEDEQAYNCWQGRIRRLPQLKDKPTLHPEALDFNDLSLSRPVQPAPSTTPNEVQLDISLKTLEILKRLETTLQE